MPDDLEMLYAFCDDNYRRLGALLRTPRYIAATAKPREGEPSHKFSRASDEEISGQRLALVLVQRRIREMQQARVGCDGRAE